MALSRSFAQWWPFLRWSRGAGSYGSAILARGCRSNGVLPRLYASESEYQSFAAKYAARKLLDVQGVRALAVSLLAYGWVLRNRNSTWTRVEGTRKESKDNIAIRAKNSRASILLLSGVDGVGGV